MEEKFEFKRVIAELRTILKSIQEKSEIPFQPLYDVLQQYCIVFTKLSSFLGIAFNDIKQKIGIIKQNNKRFPDHPGFLSFVKMEIKNKIHIFNGDNNSKYSAPQQLKTYSSTTRNLLRIMWLLTFIRVTFQGCKKNPDQKMSTTLGRAYDQAFGQKHSWIIRKGSKLAIYAASDKQVLVEAVAGTPDINQFNQDNQQFVQVLIPIHNFLWKFYRDNNLVDLE